MFYNIYSVYTSKDKDHSATVLVEAQPIPRQPKQDRENAVSDDQIPNPEWRTIRLPDTAVTKKSTQQHGFAWQQAPDRQFRDYESRKQLKTKIPIWCQEPEKPEKQQKRSRGRKSLQGAAPAMVKLNPELPVTKRKAAPVPSEARVGQPDEPTMAYAKPTLALDDAAHKERNTDSAVIDARPKAQADEAQKAMAQQPRAAPTNPQQSVLVPTARPGSPEGATAQQIGDTQPRSIGVPGPYKQVNTGIATAGSHLQVPASLDSSAGTQAGAQHATTQQIGGSTGVSASVGHQNAGIAAAGPYLQAAALTNTPLESPAVTEDKGRRAVEWMADVHAKKSELIMRFGDDLGSAGFWSWAVTDSDMLSYTSKTSGRISMIMKWTSINEDTIRPDFATVTLSELQSTLRLTGPEFQDLLTLFKHGAFHTKGSKIERTYRWLVRANAFFERWTTAPSPDEQRRPPQGGQDLGISPFGTLGSGADSNLSKQGRDTPAATPQSTAADLRLQDLDRIRAGMSHIHSKKAEMIA